MRSTSVKFDQSESKIYPKVVFSFRDGRTLTIEDPDLFKISGNGFTESAGQSAFPLGSAIAKTATLSLWNDDDRYQEYDFYMSKFSLYAYKVFDEADGGAGREEILIGNFTVIEPEDYGTAVDVTGIDDMYKFDVPYEPEYTFPISLQDAVRQECSRLGISLLTTVFKNGDILIQKEPESITSRQFIGMAAQIASGNAKMDPFNRLVIQSYDFSPFESSADDAYVLSEFKDDPQKSSDDVVITGVQIVSGEESFLSGETGYVLQLENQLISGKEQQIADLIGADVIGFRFRPFNGEHFSVIKPEFMDLVYFTDRKGTKYQSVITDYDFQFSSYTTVKCSSADPIRNSSSYTSEATKAIVQARINAEKQISEYDKAVQMMTGIMANSLGMYQTVEKTPSGGEIVYQHDKPLLSESKTIWKKTENGFMVSTDGGKTWNAGMDASGNAAVNVLSAIGLNAQWIDAGSIMVKDESGKIVFMVNLDTKEVIIDGSHIQIGDRTLEQALEETGVLAMQLSNDYANVPVDKEGNYKELDVSVKPSVFYGMGDITENCVFHITESQNISGKWSDATKTYTVESLTADTAWVEIQAVYLNKYTISKRFSVAKVYGGEDGKSYMMEASASLIEVVNGGLSPDSVTFSGYSVSEAGREEYAGRFVIRECDQNGKWTTIYTSEQNETNITYELYKIYTVGNGDALVVGYPENASQGGYGILTVPRTDIKEIECTLYAAGGTDSILFMQRVSVIKNANALTQDDIFNMLTNNGEVKGIYKEGNQLYISFTYAKGGRLVLGGQGNSHGLMEVLDSNGNKIGEFGKNGLSTLGNVSSISGDNRSELTYGRLHFYKNEKHVGRISTLVRAIEGEGRQADVLSLTGYVDGITFNLGNEDEQFWFAFFNNGFNPDGFTERFIFNDKMVVRSGLRAYSFNLDADGKKRIEPGELQTSDGHWRLIRLEGDGTYVSGRLFVAGAKNRIVDTKYGIIALNAVESPEALFSDYGSGVISNTGEISIFFDTVFSETIDLDCEYQVFVTQTSKGRIDFVEKKKECFIVHGESSTSFDWSVVCKQKDYEATRMQIISIDKNERVDFDESIFYQDNANIGILNDMKEKYEREVELL